jgi:tRNA(fMet)-specific endonuclease VapC
VSYLLDTNVWIALMNGRPAIVRGRFDKAIREQSRVYISSIVRFELWYGVAKSARMQTNSTRLEVLLSSAVTALPFDNEDSRVAGSIRAALEAIGKPIGAYDYLIAGQALARQLTLVTANVSEFSRVKGLSWQDWAQP